MEKAPEYTELERQRIKERFDSLTEEQKQKVLKAYNKKDIPTLTYKQLAINYNKNVNIGSVQHEVRKVLRKMNYEKIQIRLVNGPGSVIESEDGKFIITKKGKSLRIG